ncbi:hypothetical protein ACRQ5Q_05990 [Bradyrhizobium sp. PMVTL-01]
MLEWKRHALFEGPVRTLNKRRAQSPPFILVFSVARGWQGYNLK